MRLALCQLDPTVGDIAANCAKIIAEVERAKKEKATLAIFPELAICGYPPDDLLSSPGFIDACRAALDEIITHTESIAVIIGLPRAAEDNLDKPIYNSAAVIADRKLLGFQDKMLLPTYDVFDERRHFRPGSVQKLWTLGGQQVAVTICEDIWSLQLGTVGYPVDPLTFFEQHKPNLFVNIAASPYSVTKVERRRTLAQRIAARLGTPVALVNQIGGQDGLLFDGSSLILSAQGKILAHAQSFAEDHLTLELEGAEERSAISEGPAAELFFALVMGLRDYFVKQGFRKAFVGMSGGVDSSLTACIAATALGKDHVVGLLLPSRFTSPESGEDARTVAGNLGINTIEVPIDSLFQNYTDLLTSIFDGEQSSSVTLENIQSRIRGMILMAFANREGALLLNTGNKSELALGYTTLYGDTCGAIAVLGDLLKHQVYEVAQWLRKSFSWIPPRVLTKAPTAELRPNQKDSDSIPEYSILDPILDAYLVQNEPIDAICSRLDQPRELVADIVRRIHAAEFKRRQCPFSLRVSEKAFAYGRKIPIVHRY
jgi:NAD+ synthase (glutamine-hydrolysing)